MGVVAAGDDDALGRIARITQQGHAICAALGGGGRGANDANRWRRLGQGRRGGRDSQKTRDQIQQMQEAAQAEIAREKQSALDSLRTEVADLAVQAAEKILRENLDADRQKKIVSDFLSDLSDN